MLTNNLAVKLITIEMLLLTKLAVQNFAIVTNFGKSQQYFDSYNYLNKRRYLLIKSDKQCKYDVSLY